MHDDLNHSNAAILTSGSNCDMGLVRQEPEFFPVWLADQHPNDPQLARWLEYEAQQLQVGCEFVAKLLDHFPVKGRTVLDVGCQWGANSIALARAGAEVTGIDVREAFIRGARVRARERGVEATFVAAAAEMLPFGDNEFDAVVCVNVLEHVGSHGRTIREIVRILKPGGHVYLDGPNRWSLNWLRSDPHYQMFGISALPPWLGRAYVTKIRRYPSYDVGTFPVASRIEKQLIRAGISVLASSRPRPSSSGRTIAGVLPSIKAFRRFVQFNSAPMFYLAGRKSSASRV